LKNGEKEDPKNRKTAATAKLFFGGTNGTWDEWDE
jgi:hypothetical protein